MKQTLVDTVLRFFFLVACKYAVQIMMGYVELTLYESTKNTYWNDPAFSSYCQSLGYWDSFCNAAKGIDDFLDKKINYLLSRK